MKEEIIHDATPTGTDSDLITLPETSESLTLEKAIKVVKENGYVVYRRM